MRLVADSRNSSLFVRLCTVSIICLHVVPVRATELKLTYGVLQLFGLLVTYFLLVMQLTQSSEDSAAAHGVTTSSL